jgi:hypothetical protein
MEFDVPKPTPWLPDDALGSIVGELLRADPSERPTAVQLVARLEALPSSSDALGAALDAIEAKRAEAAERKRQRAAEFAAWAQALNARPRGE